MPTPNFGASTTNPYGLTNVGSANVPRFVDLNGDGLIDVLSGTNGGNLIYFRNTGTTTAPAFAAAVTNPFGLASAGGGGGAGPTIGDLDGDGDKDILVGTRNGNFVYFQNTGTATAPAFAAPVTNPFGLTNAGVNSYTKPFLVDIDGDGDLDMFAVNPTYNILYYQNTGTAVAPAFAAPVTNQFGLTSIVLFNPTFGDLDQDGDLDLISGQSGAALVYKTNTGTSTAPAFGVSQNNPFGLTSTGGRNAPDFGDIDGDGDLDIIEGLLGGNFKVYLNTPLTPTPSSSETPSSSASLSSSTTLSSSATPSSSLTSSNSVTPSVTASRSVTPSLTASSSNSIPLLSSSSLSASPSANGSSCATAVIESVTNKVTIRDGQTVVYSANRNLQANLPGCLPNEIRYTVEEVTHGQFERTKGKVAVRDKNEITDFTQADVDAGAISFQHDGSNQKPSYTLGITNGVVRESDKGDVTFIPSHQSSKSPHKTARPSTKHSEISSASRLSAMPEVSTSLMLGMVLAKMGSNALSSLVSVGKNWWQGDATVVTEVSTAESKQAYASFERLQTRVEHLLSQKSTDQWYRYGLEDLSDELNDANVNGLTLGQVKAWQEELGELEAEYAPSIANPAAAIRPRSNSFFKPVVQTVVMPEQPAALPAMAQRHIAA